MGDAGMLKSLVDKLNSGDVNSVSEREISLAMFYELQALNTKLDTIETKFETKAVELARAVVAQDKRIDDLEDFKTEYKTYGKTIPFSALFISLIVGAMAVWDRIKG